MQLTTTQLFTKSLKEKNTARLRSLNPNILNEIDRTIYDFIFKFIKQYYEIPTLELVQQNIPTFLPSNVDVPYDYLFDQVVNKLINNYIKSQLSKADKIDKELINKLYLETNLPQDKSIVYNEVDPEQYFTEQKLLTTDIPFIQETIGGISDTDFILFVGRMKNQKTHISRLLILDLIAKGYNGILFTNEISPEEYAAQLDAIVAGSILNQGFNSRVFRDTNLKTSEVVAALNDAKEYRINNLGILHIKSVIRQVDELYSAIAASEFKVDFIAIDGLHLMGGAAATTSDKAQSLRTVSNQTKIFCVESKIPVIAVSQSNRQAEGKVKGDSTMIGMSDALGQDASVVYQTTVLDEKKRNELISPAQIEQFNQKYNTYTLTWIHTVVDRFGDTHSVHPHILVTDWDKTRCSWIRVKSPNENVSEFSLDDEEDNDGSVTDFI